MGSFALNLRWRFQMFFHMASIITQRLPQSRAFPKTNGNDTIDCYPLETGGIKKILVVSEQTFKEIQKEFKLFFKGLKSRASQRSLNLKAPGGQDSKPKLSTKELTNQNKHFRDYEPTNAIYLNNSQWRRRVRVKEWFSRYAQGSDF